VLRIGLCFRQPEVSNGAQFGREFTALDGNAQQPPTLDMLA
jgi:hypothetical protein